MDVITELVNIFDKEKFQKEVENTIGKAAKADKIASRTAKHISEKMDEDPAFYKKFSQMLKDTISEYEAHRMSEVQYLNKVQEIMDKVLSHTDSDVPEQLKDLEVAKAYYGLCFEILTDKISDSVVAREISKNAALNIDRLIKNAIFENDKLIIDWQTKTNITGKLLIEVGDYFIDEVRDKYDIELSFAELDQIAGECIEVSKIRYK